jgi:hypothetical protein
MEGNYISENNVKMSRHGSRPRYYARKPSGEWRKGDEYVFRENENLQNLKRYNNYSPGTI